MHSASQLPQRDESLLRSDTLQLEVGIGLFLASEAAHLSLGGSWTLCLAASTQSDQQQPLSDSVDPNADDHYSLLGVPFSATHAEIAGAYRRAMKRAHPDRHHAEHRAQAERLARQLNAAYAVLRDPIKRQAYDRSIRQQVIQDQIMQRYVGGFQAMDGAAQPHATAPRREPTEAERRERMEADRKAWMLLLLVAVGITALIILAVVFGSLFGSLWAAVR